MTPSGLSSSMKSHNINTVRMLAPELMAEDMSEVDRLDVMSLVSADKKQSAEEKARELKHHKLMGHRDSARLQEKRSLIQSEAEALAKLEKSVKELADL